MKVCLPFTSAITTSPVPAGASIILLSAFPTPCMTRAHSFFSRHILLFLRFPSPSQHLHVGIHGTQPQPQPHLISFLRIVGIPSTGSAGLIQTIQMYASGHWAAGILGTVATVGWSLQGLGLAYYYRQVCFPARRMSHGAERIVDMEPSHRSRSFHGQGKLFGIAPWPSTHVWQAKTELATHGAKAYFTRG